MRELIRQKIIDSLARSVPSFTRRDVRLPKVPGKATAIIGMRRTGKTTYMWQVLSDRLAWGIEREGLLYFNFEDERLAGMTAADLSLVVEEYYRLNPEWRDRRLAVFFLDEIQNVPGWEAFARRLLDSERIELFITGSSARLLSREVATSMRGRAMEALVHPFSFREFLRHLGQEQELAPERLPKAKRSALEKHLREYLVVGGFPEAQGLELRDRHDLLRSYVDVALLRDVVERHAVTHPVALRWMVRHLLGSPAGLFSINKFYGDLRSQGLPIAKDTVYGYLGHIEDAFLIRTVSIATDSERRRMVNPRKVYPVDPALIPIFDRSGRANLGHALETCVFLDLERRGAEISYVRTMSGCEVDFLARYPGGRSELIQVCIDVDSPVTREREIRSLVEAAPEHAGASLNLITLEPEAPPELPPGVLWHPATVWLLTESQR
ncbi:MAG: ATP-binding protein [Syntrophobacteraceae bacterium]|nr:ATP-binding protein [Syntrophobacteraceae bacterium]